MASVTLAESAKLAQDDLVAGVIENIITVNQMFEMLPFDGIDGNSLAYNRENVLGDSDTYGVGDTINAKNAATFTKMNSDLTSLIGDAEVNGLIQATRSKTTDQEAVQIESKAKSVGRNYQRMFITGDPGTVATEFDGLVNLLAPTQTAGTGANGGALSFGFLDEVLDLVIDKDGQVDYLMMPARTIRSYKQLLRGLGGTGAEDMYELPSGKRIIAYSGVPMFRNDYIPTDQTKGTSTNTTTVFGGTFDDGSQTKGIAGITAANAAGIIVEDVGVSETKDETVTRVKWYCGLANFSEKGLAGADGITD